MSSARITASPPVFITRPGVALLAADAPVNSAAQCVNPITEPGWDAMVAGHPDGSLFHSAAWAAALADSYGYSPRYFVVREGGALRALLPMMEVNSPFTGRRGVSLPFTDECEPLPSEGGAFPSLVPNALALARARKWKYVELRCGRKLLGDVPASLAFHNHTVDLSGTEEEIFGRVDPAVRRAIRKAEKEGVSVEMMNTPEAMEIFYGLLCKTRKKHGMPPQPVAFFRNIHRHIVARDLGTVALARHDGRPVAGAVYFNFGRQAIYKFGASDEAFQHLRGNNLVMWEAIRTFARKGLKQLSLGRTSLGNDGLRRFKLGWGAREELVEYVKYDLRNGRFLTDRDESSGWHNKVFNVMPICLSKWVGRVLYRHWA